MSKLRIEYGPPSLLRPNAYNVNVVSPENEAKIEESLKRLGFFKPVLCRELPSGELEIIGGQHRWQAAQRLGLTEIPYTNLGKIDDNRAKELGLVDNGRYGADDSIRLAELLDDLKLSASELASFMPYSETDFKSIFASSSIELDDLDIPDEETSAPVLPTAKPVQSTQVLRFKVPIEDAGWITDMIKRVMKTQKFTESDDLTNAGDALVHILNGAKGA